MDFELSEDHKQLREQVYNFARSEVLPIIKEHDRNGTYPFELLPKMAAQGYFGICFILNIQGSNHLSDSLRADRHHLPEGDRL